VEYFINSCLFRNNVPTTNVRKAIKGCKDADFGVVFQKRNK